MVTLLAPAKLTTSLRVVGVRSDGYHLLEAEMVSLDLADELTFSEGDSLVVAEGPSWMPRGNSNLIIRALRLVGQQATVTLRKRIKLGGGLGGGSTDAAAVLRWAAGPREISVDDVSLAAQLGADVPFCLRGGRALVRGIGEQIEPLPFEPHQFTLLTPPFGCSTVAVYRAWDDLGGPTGVNGNDLEPAALAVEPRLKEWRDRLADVSGATPRLAGSGSTWFVEGAFPGEGRLVVSTVPAYE